MNISKTIDHAADNLEKVDWNTVAKELIELWDLIWKIFVISAIRTYVAGETLGLWVHRTNDQLAANWVRMLGLTPVMEEEENEEDEVPLPAVPSTPTEVKQVTITVVAEEVSTPATLPAAEVELNLPPVSTEVVEISTLQEQPPPVRRRRRSSAPRSLEETVNEEVEPTTNRRPRGRRAHAKRNRGAA